MRTALPLLLALAVAMLALGGVTTVGLVAALIGIGAAAFVSNARNPRGHRARSVRIIATALWGMAGWELLQLIPVPPGVLRAVSPNTHATVVRASALLGFTAWHPISIDPPGTAFAAATAIAVALTFDASSNVARRRGGRRAVLEAVAAVVQLFAVVALAHRLSGATRLYGIYEPRVAGTPLLAPLLNPNHAAALAAVGPPVLLGLAASRETLGGKVIAWVGAVATGTVAVLSLSRGGIAVLAAELVVMIAFLSRRRESSTSARFGPLFAAAATVLAATYAALTPLLQEFANADISKLRLVRTSYGAVRDYFLVGVGRGAFATISGAYTTDIAGWVRFSHAEHWPAQLATEVGVPATIVFCSAVIWALARAGRDAYRSPHVTGALVAVAGLVVHDLADFSLEFAAVAMIGSALAAVVVSDSGAGRVDGEPNARPIRAKLFAISAALIGVVLTLSPGRFNVEDDTRNVNATNSSEARITAAKIAMARHPAESYFPMTIGAALGAAPDAFSFLAHAIRLAPGRAAPHYWMARWFWSNGRRPQAYAEYREAVRRQANVWPIVINELLRQAAPLDELEAFASTPQQLDSLSASLAHVGRDAEAAHVDGIHISGHPPAVAAIRREIARARQRNDLVRAKLLAESLVVAEPNVSAGYIELAALCNPPTAERLLADALQRIGDEPALLMGLIRARSARRAALHDETDRLRAAVVAAGDPAHLVDGFLGDLAAQAGRKAAALHHYLDGAAASADGTAYLERAATLAEELGQWQIALESWSKLAAAHPAAGKFAAEAERVRARVANAPPPSPPL